MNIINTKIRLFLSLLLTLLSLQPAYGHFTFKNPPPPNYLYLSFTGGYGLSGDAYENTGFSSLIRIAFGSLWNLNKTILLGPELGFQTSSQIRLGDKSTEILDSSRVPIYLSEKTPIELLLAAKWLLPKRFFIGAKGGASFSTSVATGADIRTSNVWLPMVEGGIGFILSKHSQILLGYQHFFGKGTTIQAVDPIEGTYAIKGSPTWQAGLITVEINI